MLLAKLLYNDVKHGKRLSRVHRRAKLFSAGNRGDKRMRRSPLASLSFAEKEFYLDEFHEKSVLFALRAADLASETDMHAALEVFETLLRNDTRVLLLLKTGNGEGEQRRVMALHKQLTRMVKTPHASPVVFSGEESVDQICLQMWEVLRETRVFAGLWPPGAPVSLACCAQRSAVGLRVYKLVCLDPLGGLAHDGKILSFLNGSGLQDLLRPGRAEEAGLGARRPVLEAIHGALEGGVTSVSLCPLAGVGRELFTYEGCGTLFTRSDYCQVEKLGIDDFHEVEKLLQRAAAGRTPQTPDTARNGPSLTAWLWGPPGTCHYGTGRILCLATLSRRSCRRNRRPFHYYALPGRGGWRSVS